MQVTECPRCGEPVTGVRCSKCHLHIPSAETVYCRKCGREAIKEDCKEVRFQKPVTAKYKTQYICPDCK